MQPAPARLRVAWPPAGTPYHRLARTPLHRWWRPLLATLTAIAVWLAGAVVLTITGLAAGKLAEVSPLPDRLAAEPVMDLVTLLLLLALGIPAVLAAARWPQRRPPGTVSSVVGHVRWRWLASCVGLATVAIIVMYSLIAVLLVVSGGSTGGDLDVGWVGWAAFLLPALVCLALVPLQAAGEEYVFRGWIIQAFGAYLRTPYVGIVIGAVMFAVAHGIGTTWGFADLVLFGLVGGWLAVRTGGLEAGIALHVMNNLPAFLLAAAAGQLEDNSTAADSPWQLFAANLVVLPAYALVVTLVARRLRVPSRVPAVPEPQPAAPPPT